MKKTYIQPEAELLSLASLEDFLDASPVASDETVSDSNWTENGDLSNDDWADGDEYK